jgi:hypothetical protein
MFAPFDIAAGVELARTLRKVPWRKVLPVLLGLAAFIFLVHKTGLYRDDRPKPLSVVTNPETKTILRFEVSRDGTNWTKGPSVEVSNHGWGGNPTNSPICKE